MALYDYYCEANDRTVEARHGMSESVRTWGELCDLNGMEPGDTPRTAPVRRLMGAPVPMTGSTGSKEGPACGTSCGCAFDA